jgi:hypothetical protein
MRIVPVFGQAALAVSPRIGRPATTGCWSNSPTLTTTSLITVSLNSRFPTSTSAHSRLIRLRTDRGQVCCPSLSVFTYVSDRRAARSHAGVPTKVGSRIIPGIQVGDPRLLHHLSRTLT